MAMIKECRQFLWDYQNWHYENKDSYNTITFQIHHGRLTYYIRKLQLLGFEFPSLYDTEDEVLEWV